MTEEENLDSVNEDKNWKAIREENKALKEKLEGFEVAKKEQVFKEAGFDTTQGLGKAISQVYKGDMEVESLQSFAKEEYGVEVGQQDGIREQIQESQPKLDAIDRNSVSEVYGDDLVDAIRNAESKGDVKSSLRMKLAAIDEAKENS
jgi:hypothetical protein